MARSSRSSAAGRASTLPARPAARDREAVWAELESLAGASDADRELWLAERRTGVTATEVRDLAKAGDLDHAIAALVRQKLTGEDSFGGNAYTAWGKQREPVIAAEAERLYGFRPESRVFHHPHFPRWLASPDGIRVGATGVVSALEVKTAGYPLTPEGAAAKGYCDQAQWQMLILGAVDTTFAWEERIEGEWGFVAGRSGFFTIDADPARQSHLAAIADRFLEALSEASEAGLEEPDPEDPFLSALVADLIQKRRDAEVAEEYLRDYLDLAGVTSAATPTGKVSYLLGNPRRSFDKTAFNAAHPGLYEAFMVDGEPPARRTLRITPGK